MKYNNWILVCSEEKQEEIRFDVSIEEDENSFETVQEDLVKQEQPDVELNIAQIWYDPISRESSCSEQRLSLAQIFWYQEE